MAGHKIADNGKDPIVLEQVLVGLPSHYVGQLHLSIAASTDGLMIDAVANQARALCASGQVPSEGLWDGCCCGFVVFAFVPVAATGVLLLPGSLKWDIYGRTVQSGRNESAAIGVRRMGTYNGIARGRCSGR